VSDEGRLSQETLVRFERVLPDPIERVWQHLTQSGLLSGWLGEATIEPRIGGTVDVGSGHIRGVVTQWNPPHRLTYTWNVFGSDDAVSPYPESYVSFILEPCGNEVLLVLEHRPVIEGFEKLTMMGWHTFLEMLGILLRGEAPVARDVLMEQNRVRYGVDNVPGQE
jgi:uncharacterized protein YndB with AHSA1/START domain